MVRGGDRHLAKATPLGFSLVEMLVVVAIVGSLAGLLLPAVQSARESARRSDCLNRLRQVGVALLDYQAAHDQLPAGALSRPDPTSPATPHTFARWSALAQAMPYLEQSAVIDRLNVKEPMYHNDFSVSAANRPALKEVVSVLLCPSDRQERVNPEFGPTNYAACAGSGAGGGSPIDADGAFFINSFLKPADFTDGMSRTVWLAECVLGETPPPLTPRSAVDPRLVYGFATSAPLIESACEATSLWNFTDPPSFSWANGEFRSAMYNHWRPPNSPQIDCVAARLIAPITERYAAYGWRTARSMHPGGVNAGHADGSARWYGDAVDLETWRALATRSGDEADGGR